MDGVEHRQLTAQRTHGSVVSNIFHCKRPRFMSAGYSVSLRKSHYDYATERFFGFVGGLPTRLVGVAPRSLPSPGTEFTGDRGTNSKPIPPSPRLRLPDDVANAIVEPIHPKAMPVILTTPEECEVWMRAPRDEAK